MTATLAPPPARTTNIDLDAEAQSIWDDFERQWAEGTVAVKSGAETSAKTSARTKSEDDVPESAQMYLAAFNSYLRARTSDDRELAENLMKEMGAALIAETPGIQRSR